MNQYIDVRIVARSYVLVVDEEGRQSMFNRDDMVIDWIHLGATPHPFRRKTDGTLE